MKFRLFFEVLNRDQSLPECMEFKFNNHSIYYVQLHKARNEKNVYKNIILSELVEIVSLLVCQSSDI